MYQKRAWAFASALFFLKHKQKMRTQRRNYRKSARPRQVKPTMYWYIVANNPNGVWELLNREGYKNKPASKGHLMLMVNDYVKNDKENAVINLAELHPDKELITKVIASKVSLDGENQNCGGPVNFSADANSGDGLTDSSFNKLILAGSAIIALSLITVIITKSNS